jgi:excisionase family DNA binding protein
MDEMRLFVRRQYAADTIGVSLPTLDRWIREGHIQAVKIGRRVLVKRESLERLAEAVTK